MLLRQTAVYMMANLVTAVLGLIGVMVFTRMLEPGEYGVYIVALSVAGILNALFFNWGRHVVLRHQNEAAGGDVRLTVLGAYAGGMALLPLALAGVMFALDQSFERAVLAILLGVVLGLFEFGQEILRVRMDTRAFMVAAVVRACAGFGLGLLAVYFGFGGPGLVLSAALAFVAGGLVRAHVVWRGPRQGIDRSRVRSLLAYGLPITLSGVFFAVYTALDRLVVASMLGEAAAGQYGAAADLARQIITFPALAVGSAVVPLAVRLYADAGDEAVRSHLARSLELLLAVVLPCAIGLAITAPDVAALFLGAKFSDSAARLMPILAMGWVFNAVSQYYLHVSFQLAVQPRRFILQGLGGLGAALVLIPPLIAWLGLTGAAIGIAATEALTMLIGIWLTRGAYGLPLPLMGLARVGLSCLVMGGASYAAHRMMEGQGVLALVVVVAVGVASYGACVLALDVVGARGALRRRISHRLCARPAGAA